MKKGFWLLILLVCLMTPRLVAAADAPAVVDAPVAPTPLDMVTLKDGSVLYGEIIGMSDGGSTSRPRQPGQSGQDKMGQRGEAFHQPPNPVSSQRRDGADRHGHRGPQRNHQCAS